MAEAAVLLRLPCGSIQRFRPDLQRPGRACAADSGLIWFAATPFQKFAHGVFFCSSFAQVLHKLSDKGGEALHMTQEQTMATTLSGIGSFTLSASVLGTEAAASAENGTAAGSTAATGDTVSISPEGLRMSSAVTQKQEEDSDENASAAKIKDQMKDIQKKIQELQEQIQELEEQDLPDKVKKQKIQLLQSQMVQYQEQLAELQKSLTGSGRNPGGTRAEGASMSLT
ncbi:hypothetical protein [Desulfolutivibrio sp.]|uniref:hypothetical protein n=1 Tax=Desulfolutivibrio sp. TaxID=2773296 RepID=UPI002F9640AC